MCKADCNQSEAESPASSKSARRRRKRQERRRKSERNVVLSIILEHMDVCGMILSILMQALLVVAFAFIVLSSYSQEQQIQVLSTNLLQLSEGMRRHQQRCFGLSF